MCIVLGVQNNRVQSGYKYLMVFVLHKTCCEVFLFLPTAQKKEKMSDNKPIIRHFSIVVYFYSSFVFCLPFRRAKILREKTLKNTPQYTTVHVHAKMSNKVHLLYVLTALCPVSV